MKEETIEMVTFQCVECDKVYQKPMSWVEDTPKMRCVCGSELDVDQVFNEIVLEPKPSYLAFPRFM